MNSSPCQAGEEAAASFNDRVANIAATLLREKDFGGIEVGDDEGLGSLLVGSLVEPVAQHLHDKLRANSAAFLGSEYNKMGKSASARTKRLARRLMEMSLQFESVEAFLKRGLPDAMEDSNHSGTYYRIPSPFPLFVADFFFNFQRKGQL